MSTSYVHIGTSVASAADTRTHYCPNCSKRTRFFAWFQEWYGWHSTCLTCGDQWQDSDAMPRPFMRGWRKKNIDKALKMREELKHLPTTPPLPPLS